MKPESHRKKMDPFLCRENNKQYIGDNKLGNKQYIKFTIFIIFKYTIQQY